MPSDTTPDDARRSVKEARRVLGEMCAEGRGPHMSVPADCARDDDLLIKAALDGADSLATQVERLTAERDRWKQQSDDWQKRGWQLGRDAEAAEARLAEVTAERDDLLRIAGEFQPALINAMGRRVSIAEARLAEAVTLLRDVKPYATSEIARWAGAVVREDGIAIITRIDTFLKEQTDAE